MVDQLARLREAGHVAGRVFEVDRAAVAEGRVDRGRIGGREQRPEMTPPGAADRGHGFDREAAAVEAADHREDVVLAGDRERHAHGDLVGLRARDGEVHDLQPLRQGAGDALGEAHQMGVRVPGVLVPELAGLSAHDLHQLGVAVAQHVAHHAGGQVVVALAVDIEEPDPLAPLELDRRLVAPAVDTVCVPRHQVGVGIRGRVGGNGVSHRV